MQARDDARSDLIYALIDTPIGPVAVAGEGERVRHVRFPENGGPGRIGAAWRRSDDAFREAARQIGEYFAGERTDFDLPLAFSGSAFDEAVWRELERIPYGETASYGDVARRIGKDVSVSRAVGVACATNPLPIVIPCHRVIGSDGRLTGFGGGLELKAELLAHERRVMPKAGQQLGLFD